MKRFKIFFFRFTKIITVLYSLLVFNLLWNDLNIQKEIKWWILSLPHFDKLVHGGIFLFWTVLMLVSFSSFRRQIIGLILLLFALAWVTELGQVLFTRTRKFDFLDVMANAIGILLGYGIVFLFSKRLNKIEH